MRPVAHPGPAGDRSLARAVDLIHVLPARNPKAARDHGKSLFKGMQRRPLEAHVKAGRAALAPLRGPLETLHPGKPVVRVVVGVGEGNPMLLSEADILPLTQLILLTGVDIRIVEKDLQLQPRSHHRLDHLARAGGAARMQYYPLLTPGRGKNRPPKRLLLLLHGRHPSTRGVDSQPGRASVAQMPSPWSGPLTIF